MSYRSRRSTPIILIVDDDDVQRLLCREVLEVVGFAVVEASDGAAAITAFSEVEPDMVLLDVLMPGMNGFETCQAIRATPSGVATPILMATGLDDIQSIEASYQAGATDFISKPLNWALLPYRVQCLLRADEILSKFAIAKKWLSEAQRIAAVGNFLWSSAGPTMQLSAEAARIFGGENRARSISPRALLRQIPPSERARVMRAFSQARSGEVIELDHRIMLAGGETRYVVLRAEASQEQNGQTVVQGTVQDVTDRKRSERTLEIARDEAEAANAAKTAFLAAMSHEFRTPLNAIIGFAEIIAKQLFGEISQQRYIEASQSIFDAGERLSNTMTDVLTMAQLESGTYQLTRDALDLCELIRPVLKAFRQDAAAVGRNVYLETATESMEVFADARAVKQMLLKLLSNAAKFSGPETPISVILDYGPGGSCRLSVEDQGIGMTAEEAKLAVQPFHQADNQLARTAEGAGLGLSITKKLIEVHNGNLEIISAPLKGTRVILTFDNLNRDRLSNRRELVAPAAHPASADVLIAASL
jgi:two-component system cell cycle sensor histidine kinase PleC